VLLNVFLLDVLDMVTGSSWYVFGCKICYGNLSINNMLK